MLDASRLAPKWHLGRVFSFGLSWAYPFSALLGTETLSPETSPPVPPPSPMGLPPPSPNHAHPLGPRAKRSRLGQWAMGGEHGRGSKTDTADRPLVHQAGASGASEGKGQPREKACAFWGGLPWPLAPRKRGQPTEAGAPIYATPCRAYLLLDNKTT